MIDSTEKEKLPPVLEVSDIQRYLKIGRNQAYELCNSGQFHVVRIGRLIKISRDVFIKWLDGVDKEQG